MALARANAVAYGDFPRHLLPKRPQQLQQAPIYPLSPNQGLGLGVCEHGDMWHECALYQRPVLVRDAGRQAGRRPRPTGA